ncbi:MAG: dTDP-4-dehydrorhamnose reductase family protein [Planctomycetota bacterium]|jgi:dTDP-4-dehydrorhamnose reductase
MKKRILITGASGLLGGCIYRVMQKNPHYHAIGSCYSNHQSNHTILDIQKKNVLKSFVCDNKFNYIIHCAALRSPDYCLKYPQEAEKINSVGTQNVADAAKAINAELLYISTDYVFSGENPPYNESSTPSPVNIYGKTKRNGEIAAQTVEKHLIVRIPALYRTDLNDSRNWITRLKRDFMQQKRIMLDCKTVRYYTCADDIAHAIEFLLSNKEHGIIHLSAGEKTTKAAFARHAAKALGHNTKIVVDSPPSHSPEKRPFDSHLSSDKYKALKGPTLRSFSEVLVSLNNNPA